MAVAPHAARITLTWEPDPSADVFPADRQIGVAPGIARTLTAVAALAATALRDLVHTPRPRP